MPSKIVPQKHRDEMVRMYLEGSTMAEAASVFGYTYGACSFALKQAGVSSRGRSAAHRKYEVNEDFFSVIDTEEKAYWIGFLSADGTIQKRGHIKLALSVRDKDHLYKFATSLESEHPIKERAITLNGNTYNTAEIVVCSQKMVSDLVVLGIGPRKSLTIVPCDKVSPALLSHYWRGVFDGDGNIYFDEQRRFAVKLLGTQAIIDGFRAFLISSGVETNAQSRVRGNVVEVSIGGITLCKKTLEILYNDAAIFLDRKKRTAEEILGKKRLHRDWSNITASKLETLRSELGTWKSVAAHLDTDEGTLYGIRKRLGMSSDWVISMVA
jgi:hypothetical protein